MDAFAGPYAVAAVLLVVGGVLEVRRPLGAVNALAGIGVSVPPVVVRVVSGLAAVAGVAALALGGGASGRVAAGLVGVAYLGFAGFVAVAIAHGGPLASCGCFGREGTPPNATHLVLDLAGAAAAIAVVVRTGDGFRGAVADQPAAGIPFLGVTAICTGLAYLVFTRASRG